MSSRDLLLLLVVHGKLVEIEIEIEIEREREIERDQNVFQGCAIIVGCTW